MPTALAARFSAFSPLPEQALSVEERPLPGLAPGYVRLRMAFAPVNPADINVIQGTYGNLPDLPATPGIEGVGRVEQVADGVDGWDEGDLAVPLEPAGTWSTHLDVPAISLVKISGDVPPQQASMLRINPPTAWKLIHTLGGPAPGSCIIQNAATSAVGHCVTGLATTLGVKLLNLSRKPDGQPGHFLDDDASLEDAKQALEGLGAPLALNAVGGESALRLMNLLSASGTLVTYGAMARRPIKVPNSLLIFKDLSLRGFWLTRWLRSADPDEVRALFVALADHMAAGRLAIPVDTVYPLGEIREAVAHAQRPGRSGKILIDLS